LQRDSISVRDDGNNNGCDDQDNNHADDETRNLEKHNAPSKHIRLKNTSTYLCICIWNYLSKYLYL